MELTEKLLTELQKRLKIGNRKGVHLNAIPANSRYKFDLNRLSKIDKNLPNNFIKSLLSELPLKFRISWKDNVPDLNSLFEEDQTQLVKITKAFENLINQTEAIESEKGINTFGFGFPILARRDSADNKLTVAPILIWSLRIKRTKEFNTWEITRNEDDPIYLNEVLINHLQNDSNIEIEPISSEMLDDGLISKSELIEICKKLLKAINSKLPDDLEETFSQKLENITSIGDKTHYEKLPLKSTNSLIDFSGLFSIFEVQKQNIINDYGNLMELKGLKIDLEDLEGHSFQPISSVETDPSQQSILHSLEATRNVLIQGPPGTGKSQTLTAILINALENNKKTIVVCEKITALEVLEKALKEKGLQNHFVIVRDIVKDRKAVVDSVRDRVDNSEYKKYRYKFSKETLENLITKAKDLITNINSKHQKIDEKLLGNKIWTDIVGNLISEIKGSEEDKSLNIEKNIFEFTLQEFNILIDLVQKGQLLYDDYKQFESSSFINPEKFVGDNPFKIEQEIDESFEKYSKSFEKIKELESDFKNEYIKSRKKQISAQLASCADIHNSISTIIETHKENIDFLDEQKTNGIIYKTLSIFSKSKKKTLQDQSQIQVLFLDFKNHLKNSKDLDLIELDSTIKSNFLRLSEIKKANDLINSNFNDKVEKEYQEINTLTFDNEEYKSEKLTRLKAEANELKKIISSENWTTKNINSNNLNKILAEVELLNNSKNEYFSNENDLFSYEFRWFQFYNNLSETNKNLVKELKNKTNWRKSFLIHYLNSMLVESANIHLPTNDNEHIELDKALKGIENEQLKFIKDFWFSKQIDATREFEQRNLNLSVGNLYLKKQGTRNKRLSLRQIVQYDADLFTTFFPIILTSPDVASNLFKGMNGYFDIVMFDEASQLRLEDNLPAILKGKQIVIAGDEHQMPPSNYFSKVFDGSVDDEDDLEEENEIVVDKDNILLSCESLLDFASELNFRRKHLDFHYRSRHPFLIDFSNYAFYNQRLKPLPNNFEYTPIKFIQTGGTFSEHINDAEAEMVLSIIENNINRLPNGEYPTLGIATFNIAQRNHIKSKILERQKFSKYEEFNAKIQELEENGMFIKNLENIQGDERDVIILSTTYGIGKDRKFAQRFGPINHSKGYKLLNVIITRAKFKIYVCSSIPEQVFMNYKEYLTVEGSNNRRAVFFAYLAYCKAISENNNELRISVLTTLSENTNKSASYDSFIGGDLESPFEEEVYQSLAEKLGTEKLIPQLQFAGFRIDIVYDPKIIGIPKIAIECDGAKYHSSQEAYLYDRHRQKILEEHGFVFHRIWSTNWWRNTSRETTKLIDFIKNVESFNKKEFVDYSNTAFAFTDDIEMIENNTQSSYVDNEKEVEIVKSINSETNVQTKLFKDEIKLGSKIKVKYVNNGKDISVQIVETENNANELNKGLQKIYFKSALAISLIGHSVGDIVKVGNLDNFVEIMEIKN
jgi:very-short-patch-repair endonuclease/transcription elongation GreA/GreB family factor